jgi:hypothetical protein
VTPIIDVTDVTRTFGSGPNATAAEGHYDAPAAGDRCLHLPVVQLAAGPVGLADGTILRKARAGWARTRRSNSTGALTRAWTSQGFGVVPSA